MATFIQSSKSFHFPSPNKGEPEFRVFNGYVGEVPDWVTKTRLFALAVKGGDITFVGKHQESPHEKPDETTKRGRRAEAERPADEKPAAPSDPGPAQK